MDQEKKITAPRSLWDRMRATMDREGYPTMQEATRNSMRRMCEESEAKAAKEAAQ